jgi:hypothetical protein
MIHRCRSTVMPGLDPGIHGTGTVAPLTVDGRVKAGHDDEVNPVSESKH